MSQAAKVLAYLEQFRSITTMEAYSRLKIVSLHPRLTKLRRLKYRIDSARIGKTRHLRYFLISSPRNARAR